MYKNDRNHEEFSALIMDHLDTLCYICDPKTHEMLYLNKAGMDAYGLKDAEEYLSVKCYKLLQGFDKPCHFCTNHKLIEGEDYRWEYRNPVLQRWFDITDTLIHVNGRLCRLEMAKDISARKNEMQTHESLTMEDAVFRCLHTLAAVTDFSTAVNSFLATIGDYYQANRAYIFEFDLAQQTLDNTFEWCLDGVSAEIDNLQNIPLAVVDDWISKFKSVGEFSITSLGAERDPDSEEYRILEAQGIESLMAAPLRRDGQIVGFIGVDDPQTNTGDLALLRSVAEFVLAELEKRRLMAELERMSYTDALTGLGNRNDYNRILASYLRKTPDVLGVVTLDINGLKEINDTYGHEYGDEVIRGTARILQEHFQEGVYRIGGDEFVILCTDIPKEDFKEKVVELRNAFDAAKNCPMSIGFAWNFDEDTVDVNALLQQADEMRHAEKQSYYHALLSEGHAVSRTSFAGEVIREIEDDRFLVYYQPQVDLKTGAVIGAETLVRKKADDGSVIPPIKFLPFYEMGGVISHIDLFVLQTACTALRELIDQGYDLHLSVNFSRVTLLEPNIVEVIKGICAEHSVPPSAIIIEVTESIGQMDNEQLRELIENLKAAGFSISLDDFGSKYSNLSILSDLDFDEVKFDRSLVSRLEENEKSRVVMKSGLSLCRELKGTTSLAEGIETRGQLDLLAEYHCDYGQGYYFSRPLPLEQFTAFLREHADSISC